MNARWLMPAAILLTGPASAQMLGPKPYVVYRPQMTTTYVPPRYATPYTYRVTPIRPRPAYVRPYARSPYTDDWSTARHLPFPKPWMLPAR